ncbi:MAG TPA: response regulator [Spirochaetia bacterium]
MSKLKRILYGEDSPDDVELTLAAFRECNLANKVDVARDGQEVMDYLNREGRYSTRESGLPVLVLLDLKMPKLDGIDVLKRLKGDPRFRSIPVVMLTSSREERDLVESYRLGVNAYVVKPIGLSDFIEAVKQLGMFWAVINEVPETP